VKKLLAHPSLLAVCAVLALAGCGGEQDESASSVPAGGRTATTGAAEAVPPGRGPGGAGQPERKKGGAGQPERLPRQDTATGSPEPGAKAVAPGVPTQAAGDNSIQAFGTEGEVEAREQALATLIDYLAARAGGRWAEACAATSRQFKRELAAAAEAVPKEQRPDDCEAALAYFFSRVPPAVRRSSSEVTELLSFRVRDRYAYIIFRGGDEVDFIAMRNDDGAWKVNTLNPEPFASSGG
jgi:hypothetical protein